MGEGVGGGNPRWRLVPFTEGVDEEFSLGPMSGGHWGDV